MNSRHSLLIGQLLALLQIATERGVEIPGIPPIEELEKLNDADLNQWVRMVRDVLRTPL